jgi:hypothetical protein
VRAGLCPGERALSDPTHAGLIGLLLPIRLVVRGGRKWVTGADGRPAAIPGRPNANLVRSLRAGHAVLYRCRIDPATISPPRKARAPTSARERKLAQLAFLAPEIQRAILAGEITSLALEKIPLSWAEQRRLLVGEAQLGRSS